MVFSLKHAKTSAIADDPNASTLGEVLPSDWNAEHVVVGEALTAVNDTNVTLALGGTPLGSLLKATSVTVGWTGTLAAGRLNASVVQGVTNDTNVTGSISAQVLTLGWTGALVETRGGTNQSTYALGDTLYSSTVNTLAKLAGNTTSTKKFLRQTGTGTVSAAPAWDTIAAADVPGSALTKTDDTNVTLTLGGTPATALLAAASITAGWTGTLAAARLNANVVQGVTNDTNVTGSIAAQNLTLGWTGALAQTRGGSGIAVDKHLERFTVVATGVNFNSGNTDTSIAVTLPAGVTNYQVGSLRIGNASASISTATWGLFSAAAGGGTAIFAAGQAVTVTSASANTNNNSMAVTPTTANTQSYNFATLFFRIGTAQGSAATADVIIALVPIY